eukprot:GHVN01066205.1.p1 GENE.GHVN01066205.1~~GHVN01066205.1.p1  ORF type:complete len:156 (-),score=21.99 GHVN01066205.1:756-1223(-)
MEVKVIDMAKVASVMPHVSFVLSGAEAVMSNGGMLSAIGTSTIALLAHNLKKPFYVVCEAWKFTSFLPLNQSTDHPLADFDRSPSLRLDGDWRGNHAIKCAEHSTPSWAKGVDYTKPQHINLIFTDLGVFPPFAVFPDRQTGRFPGFKRSNRQQF